MKSLIEEIQNSGLFDADWYLKQYPDVTKSGLPPLEHYLKLGWKIGRDPSVQFSTQGYLGHYDDVCQSGLNPLAHYIRYGIHEGRIKAGVKFNPAQSETSALSAAKSAYLGSRFDAVTQLMLLNEAGANNTPEYQALLTQVKYQQAKKSDDAEVKEVNPIPSDWPKDLTLRPLPESSNDYQWVKKYKKNELPADIGLSVVIPTFNRSHILRVTLAAMLHQLTKYPFEIIVADDGSQEDICKVVREFEHKLDVKYVRQEDTGYRLSAVRNLGLRTAKYDYVSILDCDMAPNPDWVHSIINILMESDEVAVIGPRKYVDTSMLAIDYCEATPDFLAKLPEVRTNNSVAGADAGAISVDWRLSTFESTDNLRLCDSPFRFFSGGNVGFSKKWLEKAGWFDEEFEAWGGEDGEYGYRLYRSGAFFQSHMGAMAYHQEPPGKENETDRAGGKAITEKIRLGKVPYFYRKIAPIEQAEVNPVPLVSIYIPAYNCEQYIVRCVESALNQTVSDLEVCICDDGSTDNTLKVLHQNYGNHPRVRFVSQQNGGIGAASNTAVKLCRGFYIAQLDSDDFLEPDAVELCLKEFFKDHSLACVYTTNRNLDGEGKLIANGYNWPVYSREKLTTAMICHHFRMFTSRAWNLTIGFDEHITNAVDYDMYLKLSEVGPFKHVNKICYNRVLHGENTSIQKLGLQKINHFGVVNNSLNRQRLQGFIYTPVSELDNCRKYVFSKSML
ncbi:glycosyltransferase family 2 protein [Aeromonas veronii]|uniref:glycosyltransferase family 2 protein n=1 Tax=Aeromonas veronii TaxID=654 RepID=UPI002B46B862|nr:glycosyltransferase [Aeromonas veronii]